MASKPIGRRRQRVDAGHDANTAGNNQTINYYGDVGEEDPAVPGLLPRDVPVFTGREDELAQLAAMADGGRVVVAAVGGTAGAGKTALAVHAAHQLLPEFPDGQLYADLRGYTADQDPAEPEEVLEIFLRRLGVAAENVPTSTEERSGLLRGLLASRRVLVLLDNARSEAQVEPLLPGTGGSLVLVTSRSPLAGLAANARLMLDALPDEDAAQLLADLAGKERAEAEQEATAQVREYCGGLPLALRIAGQLLAAHPAWPVSKLKRMLADEQDRLDQLKAGDLQVRTAFEVSYRQLPDADARMFRLLGLNPAPDFGPGAAAALAGITEAEAEAALGRLTDACLVTEDRADRFGMHDLLRLFARDTCHTADSEADREAAETRLVTWYSDRVGILDHCINPRLRPWAENEAGQLNVVLPSPQEALALFSAERRGLIAAAGLAAQRKKDDLVARLSESSSTAMTRLRYLDDLLILHQAALTAARRARDTAGEGRALTNLGNAYQELRGFEDAITCYGQALRICEGTGNRHGEGVVLNNLSVVYRRLQRFEDAITCHEQALTIRRETGDRHGEGMILNNLGVTYRDLQQPGRAAACWRDAAVALREAGDEELATYMEQLAGAASSTRPRRRDRWRRH